MIHIYPNFKCPNCHNDEEWIDSRCAHCGYLSQKSCKNCLLKIDSKLNWCPDCGAPQGMKCLHCGNHVIYYIDKKCRKCGNEFMREPKADNFKDAQYSAGFLELVPYLIGTLGITVIVIFLLIKIYLIH